METPVPPAFDVGVTSWSLPASSIAELDAAVTELGVSAVQIACGDPLHQNWAEGDEMPAAARSAGFVLVSAMCSFPGEDYSSREAVERTAGFGDAALREQRLATLAWALDRTRALGLSDVTLHAGFVPPAGDPRRAAFLATLRRAAELARERSARILMETGQEPAELLRTTLDELDAENVKVNFDPANMVLYGSGDPLEAYELLAPHVVSVHVKDGRAPASAGALGTPVPLGEGDVPLAAFLRRLVASGYAGPLLVELDFVPAAERMARVADAIALTRRLLADAA